MAGAVVARNAAEAACRRRPRVLRPVQRYACTAPRPGSPGISSLTLRRLACAGINAVLYYAPTILRSLCMREWLASAIIGLVNFLATIVTVWLVDRAGRRRLLLSGALLMAVFQVRRLRPPRCARKATRVKPHAAAAPRSTAVRDCGRLAGRAPAQEPLVGCRRRGAGLLLHRELRLLVGPGVVGLPERGLPLPVRCREARGGSRAPCRVHSSAARRAAASEGRAPACRSRQAGCACSP